MAEVKEDDEHIRVFFKKDKEVIHQIVVVIRSTEGSEEDGILVPVSYTHLTLPTNSRV